MKKDNERKETRSIGRKRKEKRNRENSNGTLDATLEASYRIPRRNASQHPNKQQQSSPLFCRWTYHDHLSFSLPPPPPLLFLLLLIPLLTHMTADLYLLPIKRAELDRFGWKKKPKPLEIYEEKSMCRQRVKGMWKILSAGSCSCLVTFFLPLYGYFSLWCDVVNRL